MLHPIYKYCRLIFYIALITNLVACKTVAVLPTKAPVENVNLKKLTQQIDGKHPSFKNFRSRLRVTYNDGKREQQLTVNLRMQPKQKIWLSATMLIPIAKLMLTPKEVQFYEKFQKTFFEGDVQFLNQQFKTAFTFEEVEKLFLGAPMADLKKTTWTTINHPKYYVLTPKEQQRGFQPTFFIDPSTFLLEEQRFYIAETGAILSIKYPEHQKIESQTLPKIIQISLLEGQQLTTLKLEFIRSDFPSEITFPFAIPNGYKKIEIVR